MMTNRVRRVFLLLTALFLAVGVCMPARAAEGQKNSRTVRVAVTKYPGYCDQDADGVWSGVDVEYIENIAQHAGFQIEFVELASALTSFQQLESGEVDMIADVGKTAEREEKYLFSDHEQGSSSLGVIVRGGDDRWDYGDVDELSQMEIGVEDASIISGEFSAWCAQHGFAPKLHAYASTDKAVEALDGGKLDAVVIGSESWAGHQTILVISPTPYYFVFRKDDVELKNQVDTAMGQILAREPLYESLLLDKYGIGSERTDTALSAREKDYIASHPSVTVAVLKNDAPYYSEGKNGTAQGILPDFYSEIARATGLSFTYRAYEDQDQAVAAVVSGQADVLGMYSNGLTYAYPAGLHLTSSYTTVNTVLITPTGTSTDDIKMIAVKERSRDTLENSVRSILGAKLTGYSTARDCFIAMRTGRVDAVVIGLPSATWLVNQSNASAYRITPLSSVSLELCGAVTLDNEVLCAILDKGIGEAKYSIDGIVTNDTLPEASVQTAIQRIPPTLLIGVTAVLAGLIIGLVLLLISLRKRQREKVAVMEQAAETEQEKIRLEAIAENIEERNSFFSNISHDMRTPLNAITGFIRLAKEPDLSAAQRADYLDKAESSSRLLLDLIDDTLTMSKAGSGKLELHLEPVSTEMLGETITTPIRTIAAEKHIAFSMDKSGYRPRTVMADQLNLQKVFLNLLNNAVKYTPAGGHIQVAVRDEPQGGEDPDLVFTIRDDGIGIAEEFLPRLFEPFAQEKRPGYESGGTGLGLSIVRQLVELMGGTVTVDSEQGKGTVFTVRLHLAETAAVPAPAQQSGDAAGLEGKKVLLVEDNPLNREIACAVLQEKGLEADTAENGEEGLRRFSESAPGEYAAVLMDLRMPVMDGCAAARAIRALPRSDAGTVPIVAMTADAFSDDVQRCLEAGMNAHVAKPIDPGVLFATLSGFIRP